MTFDFNKLITIGSDKWKTAPFRFYGEKEPFFIGNKIEQKWRDIILHGNTALTLVNSKADGLNYLKLFGGTEQRNLPEGYTQLEYIESDGTQYIDIDVSGDVTFIGTAQSTTDSPTTSQALVTNSSGIAGHWFGVQSPGAGSGYAKRWGLGATQTASSTIDGTTKVDFEITFTQSSQYGTVNDQVLNRESSTSAHTNWIAFAGTNASQYGFIGKVWKLQAVQNDVLVRDFVPCKNSSNIAGMYDLVSGRFFGSLTASNFVAGPEAVPTPSNPIDIICNNGAIKARHQSGLPLGYTLLDYIKSTSNIPLGFYTNQKSEIEAKWYKDGAGAQYVYQANSGATLTNNTTAYATDGGGNWRFGNQTISIQAPLNTDIISIQNKNGVLFNNEQQGTYTDVNDFTGDAEFKALGTPSTGYSPMIRISHIKHRQNGVLLGHYVPCIAPDNSIGLYDLVNGNFYTNANATITAGDPVSDPIEIYTDGTTETVEVTGKNLFDINTAIRYRCSVNGYPDEITGVGAVSDSSNAQTYAMAVKPNTTYKISKVGGNRLAVAGFKTPTYPSDTAITTVPYTYNGIYEVTTGSATFTTDSDCVWIIFSVRNNNSTFDEATNIQLELGSTATTYEPYYYGGQATAEMLLKVGNYQDIQSVLDGEVIRKIGIKILDGTETWTASGNLFYAGIATDALEDTHSCYCTHFKGIATNASANYNNEIKVGTNVTATVNWARVQVYPVVGTYSDVATFKAWLADQYNSGNPVVVVYPLATATTETVESQALTIQEGTNIVEITQASMDNLELEVSYKAGVRVTITEVQNAQLDNNVEVTING